ncbi:MAG: hypothetical protein AAF514_10225 [Verrucomicrobiota bacterium]
MSHLQSSSIEYTDSPLPPEEDFGYSSEESRFTEERPNRISAPATPAEPAVKDQVKWAESQLIELQQQKELLERKKKELEELEHQQREFSVGRQDALGNLRKALPKLKREAEVGRRRAELCENSQALFEGHLQLLETIDPQTWDKEELKRGLAEGNQALEDARIDMGRFSESMRRVGGEETFQAPQSLLAGADSHGNPDSDEFLHWLKIGFAFSLPIMVFGSLVLLTILLR